MNSFIALRRINSINLIKILDSKSFKNYYLNHKQKRCFRGVLRVAKITCGRNFYRISMQLTLHQHGVTIASV
jgi:hypothetical protein